MLSLFHVRPTRHPQLGKPRLAREARRNRQYSRLPSRQPKRQSRKHIQNLDQPAHTHGLKTQPSSSHSRLPHTLAEPEWERKNQCPKCKETVSFRNKRQPETENNS